MSLIKFITKIFTDTDKLDESTVEVVVEIPAKTKQELFDDAVKGVVGNKLRASVITSLTEACYSTEVVEQTKALIIKREGVVRGDDEGLTDPAYPAANVVSSMHGYSYIGLEFSVTLLTDRLVEKALAEEDEDGQS